MHLVQTTIDKLEQGSQNEIPDLDDDEHDTLTVTKPKKRRKTSTRKSSENHHDINYSHQYRYDDDDDDDESDKREVVHAMDNIISNVIWFEGYIQISFFFDYFEQIVPK